MNTIIRLPLPQAKVLDRMATGLIDILDIRFGNVWTNISRELFQQLGVEYGDTVKVTIENHSKIVYSQDLSYGRSFADIGVGEPLVYINSIDNIAIAINQDSFAKVFSIGTGSNWLISIQKASTYPQNK